MRTLKIYSPLLILFILILLAPCAYSQADQEAQLVSTAYAKSEQMKPVMWVTGNVVSRYDADISSEQSGQLLFLLDVGSKVEKNAVVAQLDDRDLQLQLQQHEAQIRQLQANLSYLEKQQARMDELVKNYSTSVSEIDRNRRDLTVAKEQLAAMKIQRQLTELSIEKTQIRTPFAGTVNAHFVSLGEFISVNMPVLQLVDTEHLDIQVATPLSLAGLVHQVKFAQVKWDNQLLDLPIRNWSSAGNQASRTFDLSLDASGLGLFAGSAVQVSLPKSEVKTGVTIPRDGLILREKESFVFTVDDELKAHKVNVQIGQGMADWVMVIGALKAGDQIITRGGERLSDGQTVRINQDDVELNQISATEGLVGAG
ncbi:MAG: RND transporter [marine bacterium B5-7]|nr:MAG: RND transporter [marine bacterium B5-7]